MTEKNDGGPAFPKTDIINMSGNLERNSDGMSLRDYFAVHATEEDILHQPHAKSRQQARYMHADAMLKASEEK